MTEASLINAWEAPDDLRAEFGVDSRIQIRNFLLGDAAAKLREALLALEWRLVLNENGKHIDIHPQQVKQIGAAKMRLIKEAAQARAVHEFQYLYENFPVYDCLKSGTAVDPLIKSVYGALNAPEFRQCLSALTGKPIDYCDIQATRYRAGHFLTTHDDGIEGKNRQLAFVLNLSQRWRTSWGGQLEFLDGAGEVEQTLSPVFNTLSLFAVPQPHRVTRVASSAKSSRLALTGWFRTRG